MNVNATRVDEKHVRIGDKVLEIDRWEDGIPVVKAQAHEIARGDGRVDVVVNVPCLQIATKSTQ